ncbi:MAG: hypothetical protein ACRDSP_17310 [Pseudonocardiaceae bacterium]
MKHQTPRRDLYVITGGADESPAASLDELRAAVVMLRAELAASDVDEPAGSDVCHGLRQIEDELDADHPAGETVRARWKQVRTLLDPVRHAANIVQITGLITVIFDVG